MHGEILSIQRLTVASTGVVVLEILMISS